MTQDCNDRNPDWCIGKVGHTKLSQINAKPLVGPKLDGS